MSDKEESNDEGIGSEGEDITNCTLDNIDNMFENMNADQSDDDMEVDQEELKERRERIRGILKAHTQVQLKLNNLNLKFVLVRLIYIR